MQRIEERDACLTDNEKRLHELLVPGLGGDTAAYHAFLKALSAHLRAYFRKRLFQRPDDVEDLVQETLLAVHNQRHTYRTDQPLTAWVHAIARYRLVDLLRARASREALTDRLDDEIELFAASDSDAAEAKKDLHQLRAGLEVANAKGSVRLLLSLPHSRLVTGEVFDELQALLSAPLKPQALASGPRHAILLYPDTPRAPCWASPHSCA